MNRVVLFLMTKKGYWVLKQYLEKFDATSVEAVVVEKDKAVSNDYYIDIVGLCEKYGIKYYNRKDILHFDSDYYIVISWRWIIHTDKKVIVLHDSLLPKYRGFAPLVNSLINKEELIGVTALFATEKYDAGNVIAQKSMKIDYPIKIQLAIDLISTLYFDVVSDIVANIISGEKLVGIEQNEDEATYSLWRNEDDYLINWMDSSENIKRFIDAVGFPYLGAKTTSDGVAYRVFDVKVIPDVIVMNRMPGKIIFFNDNHPVVVCGKGLLQIEDIVFDETKKTALPFNRFKIKFS